MHTEGINRLERHGIQLSTTLIRISSASYPYRNITSVQMQHRPGSVSGGAAIGVFLACIFLCCALAFWSHSELTFILGSLASIGLATVAAIAAATPEKFLVILHTSGGEIEALQSERKDDADEVMRAIEGAISGG